MISPNNIEQHTLQRCRITLLFFLSLLLLPGIALSSSAPQNVPGVVADVLLNQGWSYYEAANERPEEMDRLGGFPTREKSMPGFPLPGASCIFRLIPSLRRY